MKKNILLILVVALASCGSKPSKKNDEPSKEPEKENLISLFNADSRLYFEYLEEDKSCALKTYHHKNFGEIPYVSIAEFCETFDKSDMEEKKKYEIKDNKFVVSGLDKGSFTFDAINDLITSDKDVIQIYDKVRRVNNGIPLDFYRWDKSTNFVRESQKTKYLKEGSTRVYDLIKYNFDIVFENDTYYAPYSLLTSVFYSFFNITGIYNGKDFFDCDCITGEFPTTSYCYSSNGNFLLDRSGGKFGAVLYRNVAPKEENEVYRFENIVESSNQLTVFSLLNNGKGTLKSYDENGQLIDEGTYIKLDYTVNDAKTELLINYYTVLDEDSDEAISDSIPLKINLCETYFGKKTRSKIVADFTYQELRFAFYELYGNTKNNAIKDFDNFIKDKEYKDKLLSLDIAEYDDAMAKLLLLGVDDAHTTIGYPSIYGSPTFANANYYSTKYEGTRRGYIIDTQIANQNRRKDAGISEGLEFVNKTAFITFDKFETNNDVKKFEDYKDTDPSDYIESPMDLFASSFNKIKERTDIENVVIDLSCNGGGNVGCVAYLLSYITKDPAIVVNLKLNDSTYEYHYEVDLNQDGVYSGEEDSFEGKYNFYVMTSDCSFSCANHFATLCRNLNFGKVIGQRNGGGSCIISKICNSSGYIYHSSSSFTSLLLENGSYVTNDNGVEPDINIDPSNFYNRTYIDSIL